MSSVRDMMAEADPDFVFGADIVGLQSNYHYCGQETDFQLDCPDSVEIRFMIHT